MAIQSFTCRDTEAVFLGRAGARFRNILPVLERKLAMLHTASKLLDLQSPPNNRLEKLKRDLQGHHAIRVNDQYRLVFRWTDEGPADVACVDYH